MKKSGLLLLIMLFFLVLSDCATQRKNGPDPIPTPVKQKINPGDKVGDFLITTAGNDDVFYISKTHCPFNNRTKTEFCEQLVGIKINVGMGIYEDNAPDGKSVDDYWEEQTCEMYIEGYSVNLEAFGTIDYSTRSEGNVRVWDVVIVSDKPGTISAQSIGAIGGNPFDYTAVVTFTEP